MELEALIIALVSASEIIISSKSSLEFARNMANLSVSSYIAQFPSSDWTHQCLQAIVAAGNQSIGYVDEWGRPLSHFVPNETWGIDRETCIKFCNSTVVPIVRNLNSAALD